MTAEEFARWCERPENGERHCELVGGVLVETPLAGERHGLLVSWIGSLLLQAVGLSGRATVAGGFGLMLTKQPGWLVAPDICVFTPSVPYDQLLPRHSTRIPPLIVEILSPHDRWTATQRRITQHLPQRTPRDRESSRTIHRSYLGAFLS
jgi:Uma2 family endonuclease